MRELGVAVGVVRFGLGVAHWLDEPALGGPLGPRMNGSRRFASWRRMR
jgi:hypothetical protein